MKWNSIISLSRVDELNEFIREGYANLLIQVAEANQERQIVKITEEIERRFHTDNPVRMVLITGPSSSGKTTFCKRLGIQLLTCGIRPISFSTDDYFVNRVDTPKFPDGRYDFDNILAMDLPLLEHDLKALLDGETVSIPTYNFTTGMREYNGDYLKLDDETVLIIEGIHALNPMLTSQLPDEVKFKIYIAVMNALTLPDGDAIQTQEKRLLRRIIRDTNKGAFSAQQTISQWPSVCEGEKLWIDPYRDTADFFFNSSMAIELSVMKPQIERVLGAVPEGSEEYPVAQRLLHIVSTFETVSDEDIPRTSLLREFLGGSSFKY